MKTASPAGQIRVLAVVPSDDFTGPSGQVASTASELKQRGVAVRVVMLRRPAAATGRLPRFLDRHGIEWDVFDDRGPLDARLINQMKPIVERWRPHVIETHGYKASALAYLLRMRRRSWVWVGFFHGLTNESRRARIYHWLDLRMLRSADRAVVISEEQRTRLLRSAANSRVVPSAVTILDDVQDATLNDDLLQRVARTPRPRVAVVGRLSPEKGQDLFLHAVSLLFSRGLSFSALLVGDGPERDRLVQLSENLGLSGIVHFLGQIMRIHALYSQLDVLVIPSRSEGLPSVLLEALDADVPVVATRVGAIPDVLHGSGAGILVEPGSSAVLADAIVEALETGRHEHAQLARAAAANAFSRSKRADVLLNIYRELVSNADK